MARLPDDLTIAADMHLADPCVPISDYLQVIKRSTVWRYPWGVILDDHGEIHMHILSDYRKRVFLRKPLREVTRELFNKYDVIHTQILKKPDLLDFELRLGWKITSIGDLLIDLEMKKEDFRLCLN